MEIDMTREEAIRRIKAWNLDSDDMEVLSVVIPELRESEDERIRKLLVWQVYRNIEDETNDLAQSVYDGIKGHDPDLEESIEDWKKCLAYLEKQKEQKEIPLMNGDADLYFDNWIQHNDTTKRGYFEEGIRYAQRLQKEQKLNLTAKGKGVYKICPHCKSRMIRDDSKVYTSMPPQYGYNCPKCGTMEFDTVMYDNPEMEEQIIDSAPLYTIEQVDEKIREAQEWSEEDRNMLNSVLLYFNAPFHDMNDVEKNMFTWLQSLPERFNLQPKQEWSEEDEKMLRTIISDGIRGVALDSKQIVWLKSRRPQPRKEQDVEKYPEDNSFEDEWKNYYNNSLVSRRPMNKREVAKHFYWFAKKNAWKPSEEQMAALNALNCHGDLSYVGQQKQLISLYNDLKKLI